MTASLKEVVAHLVGLAALVWPTLPLSRRPSSLCPVLFTLLVSVASCVSHGERISGMPNPINLYT